jgi:hypothetical protein
MKLFIPFGTLHIVEGTSNTVKIFEHKQKDWTKVIVLDKDTNLLYFYTRWYKSALNDQK